MGRHLPYHPANQYMAILERHLAVMHLWLAGEVEAEAEVEAQLRLDRRFTGLSRL